MGSCARFARWSPNHAGPAAARAMRLAWNDAMAKDDWKTPRAQAIPKEGYFELEQGRYGPLFPRTPAAHGFTIIAKILPGTEAEIRAYGERLEKAVEADPH